MTEIVALVDNVFESCVNVLSVGSSRVACHIVYVVKEMCRMTVMTEHAALRAEPTIDAVGGMAILSRLVGFFVERVMMVFLAPLLRTLRLMSCVDAAEHFQTR